MVPRDETPFTARHLFQLMESAVNPSPSSLFRALAGLTRCHPAVTAMPGGKRSRTVGSCQ